MIFLFVLAILVGSVIPVQTAANSQLRTRLNSPFLAAIINSTTGFLLLTLFGFISAGFPQLTSQLFADTPWFLWLGGPMGALILCAAIVLMPYLGGLRTVLVTMTGSILCGMVLDAFGWLYVPLHPFGLLRAGGLLLTFAGLMLVLQVKLKSGKSSQSQTAAVPAGGNRSFLQLLPLYILGLCSGSLLTIQAALNSKLSQYLGSPVYTAWASMFLTTCTLFVIITCRREKLRKILTLRPGKNVWILGGGLCGALNIIGNASLLPLLGAGTLIILTITGQLAAGLTIDRFALLGAARRQVSFSQLLGLAVILCGVVLIKYL